MLVALGPHSEKGIIARYGGGKARNLYCLQAAGLPVPAWFALPPHFFTELVNQTGIGPQLQAILEEAPGKPVENRIYALLHSSPMPSLLRESILDIRNRLSTKNISVRSSAPDEDGGEHSFAGQHSSFLFVDTDEDVVQKIVDCWASAFSDRAMSYRAQCGLPPPQPLTVILQTMIDAQSAGVLFTCDPVQGHADRWLLHAVKGVGETYVSGERDPECWELDPDTGSVLSHEKAASQTSDTTLLSAASLQNLYKLGSIIAKLYQLPMDIEWATDAKGQVWILQARPVTTPVRAQQGRLHIWDNSNIVESYGGMTLPLTFHFAHYMYHNVYVQFCEVLGVRSEDIRTMEPWLQNMIGILDGRVYYNLLNWYKLTSILPGYRYNRTFMETMMGTNQSLETEIAERIKPPTFHQSFRGRMNRFITGFRFLSYHFRIQGVVDRFMKHFYRNYKPWAQLDFEGMPADEILQRYHELERVMLWQWKAPILNDYLCMVHFGIFKNLTTKWLGGLGENFHNDLLAGNGNLESALPTRVLIELAAIVDNTPPLLKLLLETEDELCLEVLRQSPFNEFYAEVQDYIEKFGFRCMSEMKMEQQDLHQRPALFFVFLKNLLRNGQTDYSRYEERETSIRSEAETKLHQSLHGLRAWIYRWSLRNARKAVRNRENTRFCRTRIYGIARRMFWAMGSDFASRRILNRRDDIFYLTLDELKGALEGTNALRDLKPLVALRRKAYEAYASSHPDSRILTRGPVYWHNHFETPVEENTETGIDENSLLGKGCCPGLVEGIVKIIHGPEDDLRLDGEILVCSRTDPGWIPLYPSISGLLVERGGLLSHSAIVAREMGLPTIVGIPGLLTILKTGMRVRMNGETGRIEIL